MAKILVNIDLLKRLSARLFTAGEQANAIEQRLSSGMAGLEWEGPDRVAIDQQLATLHAQATALASKASDMSRGLAVQAQSFENADRESAASLFPNAPGSVATTTDPGTA